MKRLLESKMLSLCACLLVTYFRPGHSHGYLKSPPSRSSLWREISSVRPNYNDNQLNCGGYYNQWYRQNGKCGICGDPYQQAQPRDNEMGGTYGKGIVSRSYTSGEVVTLEVMITANHYGWFEFRLCPNDQTSQPVTQDCLDRYLLPLADGSGTRFDLGGAINTVAVKVKLPDGVSCSHCVLQWKWHAGNNVGVDDKGRSCKGCGPQEEFYGCADVAISGGNGFPSGGGGMTQIPPAATPAVPIITQTPQPTFIPLPPFTFRTIGPATYGPITTKPPVVTNLPSFRPISVYTTRNPLQTRPTPATLAPSQNPKLPPGFVPINPALNNPTQAPIVTRPTTTYRPLTTRVYRPPTTPVYRPPATPAATRVPITLFPAPTGAPVTPAPFVRPTTAAPAYTPTVRFTLATPRPTPALPFRPPTTPLPVRTVPTRPPTTARPTTATARPIIFTLGGGSQSTTLRPRTTKLPITNSPGRRFCYGINSWANVPILDQWCNAHCNTVGGTCPPEFCQCV